jgi:hypothetical protein
MAYATPTTYAEFMTLIDGIAWTIDCNQQGAKWADLIERVRAIHLGLEALQPVRLHVIKDESPSLNDWQTAWVDSGRELPISGNVLGLHESYTLDEREIGKYFWHEGEMRPMYARWWRGSTELVNPFPSSNIASLGTSEQKVFEFPLSMKRAGWINFLTPLAAVYTTTDTAVRWRTSQEATNSTYSLLRTRINTLTAMIPAMVHGLIRYGLLTRFATAFVGNIELWARKEASTVAIGSEDTLTFLDYLPSHVEIVYD